MLTKVGLIERGGRNNEDLKCVPSSYEVKATHALKSKSMLLNREY